MILVTGASGLIGSHLVLELLGRRTEKIRCIARNPSSVQRFATVASFYSRVDTALLSSLEWHYGSVADPVFLHSAFDGVDEVYHCAAEVSFDPRMREHLFHTNVHGTECMVNTALEYGVQRFCYVSSIAAIGGRECSGERTEDDEWDAGQFRSQYSWSKYYAEMEVWRGIAEGLPATIVNPSVVIGPGDWSRSSSALFRSVRNGLRYYTNGGTGFVDVRDVVAVMVSLVDHEQWGERFILNAENADYRTLISEISATFAKKEKLIRIPPLVASVAWRLDLMKSLLLSTSPRFTKENKRTSFGFSRYSNEKIKNTLGCSFIPLSESIRHTASVFLQYQS